jgi:hypothetical protein
LDGSCALVAPDAVLCAYHALGKTGQKAVFLPGEGIFLIREVDREAQKYGDNLALARLDRPVMHTAPLPLQDFKPRGDHFVRACGYGSWALGSGARLSGGIQRMFKVDLTWHRDYLDLEWDIGENGGLAARRNNSGGPLLWGTEGAYELTGVMREVTDDHCVAFWASNDRREWLRDVSGESDRVREAKKLEFLPVTLGVQGAVLPVDCPNGARGVTATLSATRGMRLQMHLSETDSGLLKTVREDNRCSGRFLAREAKIQKGSSQIFVGVAPFHRAPVGEQQVEAEICLAFY